MCEIRNSARNSQDVSTNNNSAAGVGWDWMGNAEQLYNTSQLFTTHHHTLQYHNVSNQTVWIQRKGRHSGRVI